MKEQFYSDLRNSLYGKVPSSMINTIIDIVSIGLQKYDLTLKQNEIVVYDYGDADLLKKYFIAKTTEGLSEKSLVTYNKGLQMVFSKIGKHIKDITTDDIRIYISYMRINGKSTAYQNLIRRTLCSFFGWLAKEKLIDENPMLRINSIREQKKLKLPFSEDELELLRSKANNIRDKAIIEFLYSTGCRLNEMVNLNISDIDFVNSQTMVLGKGNKYRIVYFSVRCKSILQEYISSRNDDNEALFVSDMTNCKGGLKSDRHERLHPSGVEVMLRVLGKKCGISNVHPHRFRRTAATLALKRGMKLSDVQKMLGHSDIKTTTIYATTTFDEVKHEHEKYII